MKLRVVVLLLVLAACSEASRDLRSHGTAATDANLIGAWDASLSLRRPYPLGVSAPPARRICGTIGFVADHRAVGPDQADVASVGVYDLDLPRLGLNWLDDSSFPSAVATAAVDRGAETNRNQRDSITIVLNPGSSERIVLLGRQDFLGIDGEWVAQSARGTASGSFSLRPHAASRQSC
jgi:hypothetical protein